MASTLYVSGSRPFGPFHFSENEAEAKKREISLSSLILRRGGSTLSQKPRAGVWCLHEKDGWNKCLMNIY